jgi:hypothetical protein
MARIRVWVLLAGCLGLAGTSQAQTLGTFRWQLQPYCNVVTITVEQRGNAFLLTGSDNQCGANAAPVMGVAALKPDGTIGIGLTIMDPGGRPAQIDATVNLGNVSGPWRDVDGNSGFFAFNPGAAAGAPRPAARALVVAGQLTPGAVTRTTLAPDVFAGSGAASTAARSDHLHDDRYLTRGELGPVGLVGRARVASSGAITSQHLSNGQVMTVTKGPTGVYFVGFPGFATPPVDNHTVLVGAAGGFPSSCVVNFVTQSNGALHATVVCYNHSGVEADSGFFILVMA